MCMWLVQLNVLCSFTLIFLLHVLHSVKFSLSTHHIFHQLVCWVIITNRNLFLLFIGDFCTICPDCFIECTQPFCLHVQPLGCSFLGLLLLFPSHCKERKIHLERWGCHEASPKQAAQRFSARKLFRRLTGRTQARKNVAFMSFINISVLMKDGHKEAAWCHHRC